MNDLLYFLVIPLSKLSPLINADSTRNFEAIYSTVQSVFLSSEGRVATNLHWTVKLVSPNFTAMVLCFLGNAHGGETGWKTLLPRRSPF